MIATLEDKLDLILGAPLGSRVAVLEAAPTPKPKPTAKDKDGEEDLGLDRRLGVTAALTRYRKNIRDIFGPRSEGLGIHERAKLLGLDDEFAEIVRSVVPRPIGTDNLPSFTEASALWQAFATSGFLDKLQEMEDERKKDFKADNLDPNLKAAIDRLSAEAKKQQGKANSLNQLLDPWRVGDSTIRVTHKDAGGTKVEVFEPHEPVYDQIMRVMKIFMDKKYDSLIQRFKQEWLDRKLVLRHFYPNMSDAQVNHTAAYYAIKVVLSVWADYEVELDEASKKQAAAAKQQKKQQP